jgi:putative FmdB family regulatory protein
MPTYEYHCKKCDINFDKRQSFDSKPITQCPECNSESQRKFSAVPVVFKGSGWYVNDYAKKSNSSTSKSAPEKNISSKPDSKKSKTSENKNKESKSTKN